MARGQASDRLTRLEVILVLAAAGLGGAGCGHPAPRPLVEGTDVCAHCHMTMVERRFGGEFVSTTGKVTPFDDVGCLAMGLIGADSTRVHSLWVSDYLEPDSVVAVERMIFIRTDSVRTPMHYGIVAVRPGPAADSLTIALGGTKLGWHEVVAGARAGTLR